MDEPPETNEQHENEEEDLTEAEKAAATTREAFIYPPNNLVKIRALKGFTQEEMAAFLGVGISTYKAWETRKHVPHEATRIRVADKLNLSQEEIWPHLIEEPKVPKQGDDEPVPPPIPGDRSIVPTVPQSDREIDNTISVTFPSVQPLEDLTNQPQQIIDENATIIATTPTSNRLDQTSPLTSVTSPSPTALAESEPGEALQKTPDAGKPAHSPATTPVAPTQLIDLNRRNIIKAVIGIGVVALVGGGAVVACELGGNLFTDKTHTQPLNKWIETGSLIAARYLFSATLLHPSGKVLVAGGLQSNNVLDPNSELYDPEAGTWKQTGKLINTRLTQNDSLVTLANGKALLAGGYDGTLNLGTNDDFSACELYDPKTDTWSATGGLNTPRRGATMTLLNSGKVLIAAGAHGFPNANQYLGSAELYDPDTGTWEYVGNLVVKRQNASAVLLPDGRVMVAGGEGPQQDTFGNIVELYDPGTQTWSQASNARWGFWFAPLILLKEPDERVFLAGGGTTTTSYANAALYDPQKNTWEEIRPMSGPRAGHTASLLPDGKVLIIGGTDKKECEIYDPKTNHWSLGPSLKEPRGHHIAITLGDGDILVIGGRNGNGPLASCERLQM
jgi:N-acetylneuraminic acid mutarotase/transcriptional regulator with XRE-family HTH domain